MYESFQQIIAEAEKVLIIQAENPDGDSLGTSLALEEILGELGKKPLLYCPVDIPKYLRHARGWDRVTQEWPKKFDVAIIVDTASEILLERALIPEQRARLEKSPVIVIDHHETAGDLQFKTIDIVDNECVATGELVYKTAKAFDWPINSRAAENLVIAIMADSLGLTTPNTTSESVRAVAELVELGASLSEIENRRREFMKKSPEILAYKGRLIERIEYHLDGQLGFIHIPWNEIEQFSNQYNPSMLVLDEMRLVEGVKLGIALKSYPDGKITGKIRANPEAPIAEIIAGYFGGGGHMYAAGFRVFDNYETVKNELIQAVRKALEDREIKATTDSC